MNLRRELLAFDRRIAALIREGDVVEVVGDRVVVDYGDDLQSPPLRIGGRAGARSREWRPPAVGSHVVVLSASGETGAGVVIAETYTTDAPAPAEGESKDSVVFADGTRVEYDSNTHTLKVHSAGAVEVVGTVRLGDADASDPVVRRSDLQAALDAVANAHNALANAFAAHGHPVALTPAPPIASPISPPIPLDAMSVTATGSPKVTSG